MSAPGCAAIRLKIQAFPRNRQRNGRSHGAVRTDFDRLAGTAAPACWRQHARERRAAHAERNPKRPPAVFRERFTVVIDRMGVGAAIAVRPGDIVPLDGVATSPDAILDEAVAKPSTL